MVVHAATQKGGWLSLTNLDAERALVGAMCMGHELTVEGLSAVRMEDFSDPVARGLFRTIHDLVAEDTAVTLPGIRGLYKVRKDDLQAFLDAGNGLSNEAFRATVKEVQRVGGLRKLAKACEDTMATLANAKSPEEAVGCLEKAIYGSDREGASEAKEGAESVRAVYRTFLDNVAKGGSFGISTGLRALDRAIIGLRPGKMLVIAGRPGMGKALDVNEPVMTPCGPKRMGDLAVGDMVLGANGQPAAVTGVFPQGHVEAFRVTFDDGLSVVTCADHQWLTRTRAERRSGRAGEVRTTREIAESIGRGHRNHSIPLCGAWQLESDGPLPLDPYLLGAWLGDGDWGSCLRISNSEEDVILRCSEAATRAGDSVRPFSSNGRSPGIRIVGGSVRHAIGHTGLEGADCFTKFIPVRYLYASPEDRLELLRGLMDTDGYVDVRTGCLEFATASQELATGVEWLVRSLGGVCSTRARATHYRKDGVQVEAATSYRMNISFPNGNVVPVSSKKHLAKWHHGPKRVRERFVVSVESVGPRECQCISVDAPDHLYLTGAGIVTHNTALADSIRRAVIAQGYAVVHFSLEMGDDELAERELAYLSGVNLRKIMSGFEVTPEERERVEAVMGNLKDGLWYIDDKTYSIAAMRRRARIIASSLERQGVKVGLVIVDYLQLSADGGESREQSIAQVSRGAKAMAKELGCTCAALSQLNRGCEMRDDKRPLMSDLRESGAIEQDADIVLMVYRDKVYNGGDSDEAELIIRKQRGGPTGTVRVRFREQVAAFEDIHCHHEGGTVPGDMHGRGEEVGSDSHEVPGDVVRVPQVH